MRPTSLGALGYGQAVPGQRGLVDLQRGRLQQPPVRGHDIARLDRDDVAGNQLPGGDLRELAVPPHPGLDDHHLLQGGDGRGGLPLLMQALDRAEQRQQDQQDARAELLERVEAADAGREQDDLHGVGTGVRTRASAIRPGRRQTRSGRTAASARPPRPS
jgi:hypothetical protein